MSCYFTLHSEESVGCCIMVQYQGEKIFAVKQLRTDKILMERLELIGLVQYCFLVCQLGCH
ncbi:MAG: hypothetical protein C0614_12835 [Desulfuromonas sp.]|nr:MAG: hypothetical protein C0614_12835 [Desulfuromonas sp.]